MTKTATSYPQALAIALAATDIFFALKRAYNAHQLSRAKYMAAHRIFTAAWADSDAAFAAEQA